MNVSMLRNLKMMCPYEGKMLSKNEIAKMGRDIPISKSKTMSKLSDLKIKDPFVGQRYTPTPERTMHSPAIKLSDLKIPCPYTGIILPKKPH